MSRHTINYQSLVGGTELFPPSSVTGRRATVNLPFSFRFYDATYDAVTISQYGVIVFGTPATISSVNQAPGSDATLNDLDGWIAPFWDSLRVDAGGYVSYRVEGSAPTRV